MYKADYADFFPTLRTVIECTFSSDHQRIAEKKWRRRDHHRNEWEVIHKWFDRTTTMLISLCGIFNLQIPSFSIWSGINLLFVFVFIVVKCMSTLALIVMQPTILYESVKWCRLKMSCTEIKTGLSAVQRIASLLINS